jgi:hypothetical protein
VRVPSQCVLLLLELKDAVGLATLLVGGLGQIPPERVDWVARAVPVDPNRIPSDASPTTISRLMRIPPPLSGMCAWQSVAMPFGL